MLVSSTRSLLSWAVYRVRRERYALPGLCGQDLFQPGNSVDKTVLCDKLNWEAEKHGLEERSFDASYWTFSLSQTHYSISKLSSNNTNNNNDKDKDNDNDNDDGNDTDKDDDDDSDSENDSGSDNDNGNGNGNDNDSDGDNDNDNGIGKYNDNGKR